MKDPHYFTDGYGVVEGDRIVVGANAPARVTKANYDTGELTLDRRVTWRDGDPVHLEFKGKAPDIGPYEFGE